jgi:Family of unknown function (DUF6518)
MGARVKPWKVVLVIAGAGLAVGVLTVYGQGWLPGQLSTLTNSGAVWLVFAFAVGSCMRSDVAAAAAGAGVLVCAVIGYYVAVPIIVEGAAASLHSVAIWTGTALVGGPVFGVAGRWWRARSTPRTGIALGVLGGVFVAEGLYDVTTIPDISRAGWVMLAVGLVVPLALGRSAGERLLALGVMVPVAAITLGVYAIINRTFISL